MRKFLAVILTMLVMSTACFGWPFSSGLTKPSMDINVSASNSTIKARANADYVCDGTDDHVQIQAAIDSLTTTGGTVYLSAGDYIPSETITMVSNVNIKGIGGSLGKATIYGAKDIGNIFYFLAGTANGKGSFIMENLFIQEKTSAGVVIVNSGQTYTLASVNTGTETITFAGTAADAAIILAGDIMAIIGGANANSKIVAASNATHVGGVVSVVCVNNLTSASVDGSTVVLRKFKIIGVDQGTDKFTVEGDYTSAWRVGDVFMVGGSTGNDAKPGSATFNWRVESVTLNGSDTDIGITGEIPNATVDGFIERENRCIYIDYDGDGVNFLHDAQFISIYTGHSDTGGMFVINDWSSHFDRCTFEHTLKAGFECQTQLNSSYVSCYFALNSREGFIQHTGAGLQMVNCAFNSNGGYTKTELGNYAGFTYKSQAASNYANLTNCSFSNNGGSGMAVANVAGSAMLSATNCISQGNNSSETNDTSISGVYLGTYANDVTLTNFKSRDNLGASSSGFYIDCDGAILQNCYSGGHVWGVFYYINSSGTQLFNMKYGTNTVDYFIRDTDGNRFFNVKCDVFLDLAATAITGVYGAITDTTDVLEAAITQPAYPRSLIANSSGGATGTVRFYGYTADGKYWNTTGSNFSGREDLALVDGGDATGVYPWARLIIIDRSTSVGQVDSIGPGNVLGLSNPIKSADDILQITLNGVNIWSGTGAVLDSGDVDLDLGTIDFSDINASAGIGAGDDIIVRYISE